MRARARARVSGCSNMRKIKEINNKFSRLESEAGLTRVIEKEKNSDPTHTETLNGGGGRGGKSETQTVNKGRTYK